MTSVQVGQIWRDKDKRRDRSVEIIRVSGDNEAHALVIGTENETSLKIDRLVKRWELVREAPKPVQPVQKNWNLKVICPMNPDFKVRMTRVMQDRYGMPLCPCHESPMEFV